MSSSAQSREPTVVTRTVCLLNGSLRGKAASSRALLERVAAGMRGPAFRLLPAGLRPGVNGAATREELETAAGADALVIAFPLFTYSLPGAVTAFLEDLASLQHADGGGPRVYALVNCGFPEPWIMGDALRVVRNFCARMGWQYRFSVAVATGPATVMTMKIPLLNLRLKRALRDIGRDVRGELVLGRDHFEAPVIPKGILLRVKEHYERKSPSVFAAEDRVAPPPLT